MRASHMLLLLHQSKSIDEDDMPQERMMIFIDGENLVFRYQDMLHKGCQPQKGVTHIPDVFVWPRSNFPDGIFVRKTFRANFYTSAVGDEKHIAEITNTIRSTRFRQDNSKLTHTLTPQVFRKLRKREKKRAVDIQMTIDVLTHTYQNNIEIVFLMSGDGDFKPLIQEVQRNGKVVYLAAFSSGLDKELIPLADGFLDLDPVFFVMPTET